MRSAWIMLSLVISGSILARASIGQARAQEVPVTKCDVYAASDTEPQHKFKMFHMTRSILLSPFPLAKTPFGNTQTTTV